MSPNAGKPHLRYALVEIDGILYGGIERKIPGRHLSFKNVISPPNKIIRRAGFLAGNSRQRCEEMLQIPECAWQECWPRPGLPVR